MGYLDEQKYFLHEKSPVSSIHFLDVLIIHEGPIQHAMSLYRRRHRQGCQMWAFFVLVLVSVSDPVGNRGEETQKAGQRALDAVRVFDHNEYLEMVSKIPFSRGGFFLLQATFCILSDRF